MGRLTQLPCARRRGPTLHLRRRWGGCRGTGQWEDPAPRQRAPRQHPRLVDTQVWARKKKKQYSTQYKNTTPSQPHQPQQRKAKNLRGGREPGEVAAHPRDKYFPGGARTWLGYGSPPGCGRCGVGVRPPWSWEGRIGARGAYPSPSQPRSQPHARTRTCSSLGSSASPHTLKKCGFSASTRGHCAVSRPRDHERCGIRGSRKRFCRSR